MVIYTFFKHHAERRAPAFQLEGFANLASAEAHARILIKRSGYSAVDIFDGCEAFRLLADNEQMIGLDYTSN